MNEKLEIGRWGGWQFTVDRVKCTVVNGLIMF